MFNIMIDKKDIATVKDYIQNKGLVAHMKLEYCKNNQIPLFIIKYNENIKERLEEILNELYGQ